MYYKFGGSRDKQFTERFIFTSHAVIFTCTLIPAFFLRRNLICFCKVFVRLYKLSSFCRQVVLCTCSDKEKKIMDGNREMTSSSFTSDLFGTTDSPSPSSTGIFASILSRPSSVVGRNSLNSEVIGTWQKQPWGNQAWNNKQGTSARPSESESCSVPNKHRSSIFQEERAQPCHLSSSLYYGGQDIYSRSPGTYASPSNPIVKKDGAEDDPNGNNSHGASRGNWWQGSLYY